MWCGAKVWCCAVLVEEVIQLTMAKAVCKTTVTLQFALDVMLLNCVVTGGGVCVAGVAVSDHRLMGSRAMALLPGVQILSVTTAKWWQHKWGV